MDGRRENPRWKIKKQFKATFDNSERIKDCFIEDINLKGMRLTMAEALPQNTSFRMGIDLTEDLRIDLNVEVPWVKGSQGHYVHGVRFNRIFDEDKDKICHYINNHCTKELHAQWWQYLK